MRARCLGEILAGVLRNRDHPGFRPGTSCYQVFALNDDRGVVYICWDADHAPIYVGQTVGWPSRKQAFHAFKVFGNTV